MFLRSVTYPDFRGNIVWKDVGSQPRVLSLGLVSYLEPPLTQEQSHYAVSWFPTPREGVPRNPIPCSVPALLRLPGLLEVGATRAC